MKLFSGQMDLTAPKQVNVPNKILIKIKQMWPHFVGVTQAKKSIPSSHMSTTLSRGSIISLSMISYYHVLVPALIRE